MAGHSKWAQIKRKKEATDAKKSQIFSKFAKLIASESKKAKGDRSAPGLRLAIMRAKVVNMPNDNIDRAIEKGKGDGGTAMDEVLYEAYGPGGVAVLIVGLTDNRNRTAQEIKHLLSKNNLSLAAPGAASWAFTKTAEGYTPQTTLDLSDTDLAALETMVTALEEHDDVQEVFTNAA
ncbi:hypothetical protein A3D66_01710 [Candidatus Kaiserbacteria bacterium RIFCSPHIGHO2_02_FULL_50_9]|uniref:Transcriptional regulator n=1 Tax=Candidatus Kaiserbacteria bacterium RIFCSPLOWO2_01_FULL_51_21 TaxID=1798508 RepID=A0A1F6EEK8_9BACT|nr:MAG: hypothetical protein A2761_02500 [Candidatus Kaiserbacteria bacterium RIFCSPHIGHO2_01_FULL_51_33]OGG63746.1 MAG: hypothetical protein A3D66_01710 [Candidatus Kaiserbacteria bacterium RIFCSPHIGHO2_02_FULL_50_9]OGG71652.1 MAG: hypothetical protein A3A35_00590 [Candidatus Kaiserbacteria bacterium RIFCSPLOWO2_01_FULL_51_21]